MTRMLLVLVSAIMTLSGCAHVMSEANLKLADQSIRYAALNERPDSFAGKTVLVGGIIAGVKSSGDIAMLEVVQLELFKNGVPDENSHSSGRFLAVSSDLIDPVIYRTGELVTIIGEVKGKKVQKLNSVDYSYPLVSAKEMRLFRASEPFPVSGNPYLNEIGDSKFLRRPPGLSIGEPQRLTY